MLLIIGNMQIHEQNTIFQYHQGIRLTFGGINRDIRLQKPEHVP